MPKTPDAISKWDESHYVTVYKLAREGMKDGGIAQVLGVTLQSFRKWQSKHPALNKALELGRSSAQTDKTGKHGFVDFVSARLPKSLKGLWDDLLSPDEEKREEAVRTARDAGRRCRQHLFMHAYIACHFSVNRAARQIGLSPVTVAHWKKHDKKFGRLMEVVQEAKKDFFEDALMDLVAAREVSAVLFVNKTANKDRGYDPRVTIKVEGGLEHKHSIAVKDLSPDTIRAMLTDVRRRKDQALLENKPQVIDAEFTRKGD